MRFSICVMADVDEIGFFSHAEVSATTPSVMFATGVDEKWRFSEEFARRVMARYQSQ